MKYCLYKLHCPQNHRFSDVRSNCGLVPPLRRKFFIHILTYLYKILMQDLKLQHINLRHSFAVWALEHLQATPLYYGKIVFRDEDHFWLNGFVNKLIVSNGENLQTPLHSDKLIVWCSLHAVDTTGPHFFKNCTGGNITVNRERYRTMINEYLFQNI